MPSLHPICLIAPCHTLPSHSLTSGFLSSSWHVRSKGAFAASIIGIFFLAFLLEALRTLSTKYESYLNLQLRLLPLKSKRRISPLQQLIRALLHVAVFGVAYILMLLAMYFNGFVILTIFLGVGVGKFVCDWLSLKEEEGMIQIGNGECEPTVCCG